MPELPIPMPNLVGTYIEKPNRARDTQCLPSPSAQLRNAAKIEKKQ